jgi:60 kDa SS-A/Ro ribonucleoprotein
MANKSIFTSSNRGKSVSQYTAVNEAGGRAYNTSDEAALAQYVVTGCLNGTYYASADTQVDTILQKAKGCSDKFVAQAALYARHPAKMKDTTALLAVVLGNRGDEGVALLGRIFDRVIDNQKQLRNFVQIWRSGKVGRKSFGTAIKRMIQNWLRSQEADRLFKDSVGNAPSLADVVKMAHPKPANKQQEALFGWLLGREYNKRYLPDLLKAFEKYKADPSKAKVPDVDFRMLTALNLDTDAWCEIGRQARWNMVRMNLNTFQRHDCFKNTAFVKELAAKLADADAVRQYSVFPYQLLTTFKAVDGKVPVEISLAVQDAMEYATENVPVLNGRIAVCVDVSDSMRSPVTGHREGATTTTSCVDIAGLVAASVLRKNPSALIVPFDTSVREVSANPRDSVMTNARKFAMNGGGTDCSCALQHLNAREEKLSAVIFVSDNESWYRNAPVSSTTYGGYYGRNRGTAMAQEWATFKSRNPKAKLVCIDIQPYQTVQVQDNKDVLNVGGFSDSVFSVVANFINGDSRDFVKVIQDTSKI